MCNRKEIDTMRRTGLLVGLLVFAVGCGGSQPTRPTTDAPAEPQASTSAEAPKANPAPSGPSVLEVGGIKIGDSIEDIKRQPGIELPGMYQMGYRDGPLATKTIPIGPDHIKITYWFDDSKVADICITFPDAFFGEVVAVFTRKFGAPRTGRNEPSGTAEVLWKMMGDRDFRVMHDFDTGRGGLFPSRADEILSKQLTEEWLRRKRLLKEKL
jgi:hypothetical protein